MAKARETVLMLRTSQNPQIILSKGQLEDFEFALKRARACLHAVLCQHDTHEFDYSDPVHPHRFGFAVARDLEIYDTGRKTKKGLTLYGVAWKLWAPISCPDLYPTFRRAFHYATPDEVPFDLDALDYQPVVAPEAVSAPAPVQGLTVAQPSAQPQPHAPDVWAAIHARLAEAKALLASVSGIQAQRISINITITG